MSIITVVWDVNNVGHYNFLSANSIFWRSDFAAECEDAVEHSQPVIIITHFYYLADCPQQHLHIQLQNLSAKKMKMALRKVLVSIFSVKLF